MYTLFTKKRTDNMELKLYLERRRTLQPNYELIAFN